MDVTPTIHELHGRLRSITGTDPAANTEISETVPERRRWILRSFHFQLVTDVNGANRYITIIIDDGTNVLFQFRVAQVQIADKTYNYSFADINVDETFVDPELFHPLPNLTLFAGCRIRTITTDRQVTDNYGAPQMLIEEWID